MVYSELAHDIIREMWGLYQYNVALIHYSVLESVRDLDESAMSEARSLIASVYGGYYYLAPDAIAALSGDDSALAA